MYIFVILNFTKKVYSGGKHMKKKLFLCLTAFLAVMSTGCMRAYSTYTVNDDGSLTVTSKTGITKEFTDQTGGNTDPNAVLETLEDGKEYYTKVETQTGSAAELIDSPNVTINKDIFYYKIDTNNDSSTTDPQAQDIANAIANSIYVKLTVNLADDIVDTNANLKEETSGKTAAFDTTFIGSSWYAYTARGKELIAADTTAPVISNVNDGAYYNSLPDIQFSDDTVVANTTINGKAYSELNITNGKNVVTATDINGNSTTVTFYTDLAAPVIKGIKDGRVYRGITTFYVKDKVALSKVTLDGKKQKIKKSNLVKKGKYKNYYKYTIKKKGKHTIIATDGAGNKTKIKITIR